MNNQNLGHKHLEDPGIDQNWFIWCFNVFITTFALAPRCDHPLITAPAEANICHQNLRGFVTRPTGFVVSHLSCAEPINIQGFESMTFVATAISPMILPILTYRVFFFTGPPPKKLKYGKPRYT